MDRGRGGGIAQSGPKVDAGRGEIDRSRRNLNTEGDKVMIGRRRRVLAKLTKSRSKEWLGTRDSRCSYIEDRRGGCWKRRLKITDRVGAPIVCWRRKTNRACPAVPDFTLIGFKIRLFQLPPLTMPDEPQKFTSLFSLGLNNTAEQPDPIKLDVHGQIPPWLSGALYRTGPGTFSVPTKHGREWKPAHWFDGLGLNHKFDIKPNGEVWYRSRTANPKIELAIMQGGGESCFTFGGNDPCETYFQKFSTCFKRAVGMTHHVEDNVSVTLTPNMPGFAVPSSHSTNKVNGVEYIVAKTDGDTLSILDPETLELLGPAHYKDLDPALKGAALTAAHACTDPANGDLFNFVYEFGPSAGYTAFRIQGKGPDRGKLTVLAKITDTPAVYIHSSALTEKYFILCVWQADIKWYVFPNSP